MKRKVVFFHEGKVPFQEANDSNENGVFLSFHNATQGYFLTFGIVDGETRIFIEDQGGRVFHTKPNLVRFQSVDEEILLGDLIRLLDSPVVERSDTLQTAKTIIHFFKDL